MEGKRKVRKDRRVLFELRGGITVLLPKRKGWRHATVEGQVKEGGIGFKEK